MVALWDSTPVRAQQANPKRIMTEKPNVKIYTTTTCRYCKDAKDYFNSNNIPFEEINVSGNSEKIAELRNISGSTAVPVISIDDSVIVGFNRSEIDHILSLYKEI